MDNQQEYYKETPDPAEQRSMALRTAMHYGLIGGMACIALGMLYYLINVEGFVRFGDNLTLVTLGATLVMAVLAVRRMQAGLITWRQGLQAGFVVWVLGNLVFLGFRFLLYRYFDTGLVEIYLQNVEEQFQQFGGMDDAQAAEVEKAIDLMRPDRFSGAALNYAVSLIFPGFFLAAILALVLRKKPSEATF
jgi:hypothetical protein